VTRPTLGLEGLPLSTKATYLCHKLATILGNYHRDYSLYLVVADSTTGMVLVQDDDDGSEHVIYYLSCNLLDTKTCHDYVDKLALETVQVVQRFCHYILLCTTTMISNCNLMTYILSRQLLGGEYSKWIVIL